MKVDLKYLFTAINPVGRDVHTQEDGMVFLANDKAVPAMLDAYILECKKLGADHSYVKSIELLKIRVLDYQKNIECKIPDIDRPE